MPISFPPSRPISRSPSTIDGAWGGVGIDDAILRYLFDEGTGDDVINHGTLAPDGTVDAGTITWSALGGIISGTAGTDSIPQRTLTEGAVFCAFKLPLNATTDQGLFADAGNDCDLILRSYPGVMSFKFGASSVTASFGQPNDNEWHILEGVYRDGVLYLAIDGVPLKETAAAALSCTLQNLVVGALNNGTGITPATIGSLAVFERAPSDTSRKLIRSYMHNVMTRRGATFPTKNGIFYEGDSITASVNVSAITVWGNTTVYARNFAVGGSTIEHEFSGSTPTLRKRLPALAAAINACDSASLFVMIGANDLNTIGTATYMTQLESYCDDLRSMVNVPLTIYIKIPTPRTDATFTTNRATLIPLLQAAEGTFFERLVELHLDTVIGSDAAASDTDLFSDGTHTTPAADLIVLRNDKAAWQDYNNVAFSFTDYLPKQWFDAQATGSILDSSFASISDGEDVGRWNDQTASTAHNAEKAGANPMPKYRSSGLNGHPTVHFTAEGQILTHGYSPAAGQSHTLFIVTSVTGGQTGDRAFYGTAGAFSADGVRVFSRAGGDNWGVLNSGFGFTTSSVNLQAAGLAIICIVRSEGPGHMWTNGVRNAAFNGTYNSGLGNVGGDLTQTTIGHLGEIAFIESTLAAEEIKRCMNALYSKWT